jgi:hypothetical protein
MKYSPLEVIVALSAKERERIIEEETLRFETRRNLHKKSCAERPVRWPWIILGILLVYGLWSHIFHRSESCSMGMMNFHHCPFQGSNWAPDDHGVAPGQPIPPEKK